MAMAAAVPAVLGGITVKKWQKTGIWLTASFSDYKLSIYVTRGGARSGAVCGSREK